MFDVQALAGGDKPRRYFISRLNKVSSKRRLWPQASSLIGKETDERRTSNIQHRTSNIEHRILIALRFIDIKIYETTAWASRVKPYLILQGRCIFSVFINRQNALFEVGRWTFDVRCSMFDVRVFSLFQHCITRAFGFPLLRSSFLTPET
jgi:hypothetical protein